ncbi:unnamed protein product, partial [Rotaria magnacalcarata]
MGSSPKSITSIQSYALAQRPNQSLSVENNTVQVREVSSKDSNTRNHISVTRINQTQFQSQNGRKLKRKRKSNYLTVNGHVTIDRLPYDHVFTSWSSDSIEIEEKEIQQSKKSLINVTIQGSDDRQENFSCLTAKGYISIERVSKDELPLFSRSNNENSILQKQVQRNSKLKPVTEKQVSVTHIKPSELQLSPIYKEEEHKKNQEYLTVNGHVTVGHTSKDELTITSGNNYNPTTQYDVQNAPQNYVRISRRNLTENELKPSFHNSCALNKNGHHGATQNHVTVKIGTKFDSPIPPVINVNSSDKRQSQQQFKTQVSITHINPSQLELASIHKEEVHIKNHEYLTANRHATANGALKSDLLASQNVDELITKLNESTVMANVATANEKRVTKNENRSEIDANSVNIRLSTVSNSSI